MVCSCCTAAGPPSGMESYSPNSIKNVEYNDSEHLSLPNAASIKTADLTENIGYDPKLVAQLPSSFGVSSSFPVLSEEGVQCLTKIVSGMEEKFATTSERIPKLLRGATFRSKFLNDFAHSQSILSLVSKLAGCELIYHPMKIHQLHMNFNATNEGLKEKSVDKWHVDTTPFVLVLFLTDPKDYEGGELQYFQGTKEEGIQHMKSKTKLHPERIFNVGEQKQGYGVFMQGSRIFHQVTPVTNNGNRTTLVFSFQPKNVLALEACDKLSYTYNKADPLDILIPDWVRYRAWKITRRIDIWRENNTWNLDIIIPKLCGEEKQLESNGGNYICPVSATDACYKKMGYIVDHLPYKEDREYLVNTLKEAATELREFIQFFESNFLFTPSVCFQDFVSSPYGWKNLTGILYDVEQCVEDVLTANETKMIYFDNP